MENLVELHGNTYPLKDEIKAAGGRWNNTTRKWSVPREHAEALQAKAAAGTPKLGAQLWEECPRCGNDPIYVPPGVCADCAARGRGERGYYQQSYYGRMGGEGGE